jgi:hypothetical protein
VADYTKTAAGDIRRWLWAELVAKNILDPGSYHSSETDTNLIPIIPVSQRSEFVDQFGKEPFIVYDYVIDFSEPDFWMINCEQIMFTIYTDNYGKANQIKSLMVDMFRRNEDSARDLNSYNSVIANTTMGYLNIQVLQSSKTEPVEEVGGRYASDLTIEVRYVRSISSSGISTGRYA